MNEFLTAFKDELGVGPEGIVKAVGKFGMSDEKFRSRLVFMLVRVRWTRMSELLSVFAEL